ncbi:MAG: hypothetical protein IJX39_04745 [Clostridia bacterium]|nr:hypothetical protein [Clostridia bacterium]
MKEKSLKLWRQYILWGLASFASLVAPLTAVLIVNRERYFTTVQAGVKLGIGGLLCVAFLALLIFGKMKAPGSIFLFAFVFLLAFLMEPIFKDIKLLSGVALAGKAVDWIFFAPRLRRVREKIRMHEQADVTADATVKAMEDVLKKYVGRV